LNLANVDVDVNLFGGTAAGIGDGNPPRLLAELGDHYVDYHAALRKRWDSLGGRPHPDRYADPTDFFVACQQAESSVQAEVLLRAATAFRQTGRRLSAPADASVRLVDDQGDLVPLPADKVGTSDADQARPSPENSGNSSSRGTPTAPPAQGPADSVATTTGSPRPSVPGPSPGR
jgi:hypothetical protein